jgi:hypothetical protein
MKKETKILFCLLYWNEDRLQVEKLARLMADLLPEITEQAQLMFVARYDAKLPSMATQAHVQGKFEKVLVWQCNRKGEGFPGGCNEMAYGTFNHILTERHLHGNFKDVTTIMILEGDVVFTRPGYIQELVKEWEKREDAGEQKYAVGAVQTGKEEWHTVDHLNAVAMYDVELARLIPVIVGGPMHIGWDNYHGPTMIPHAVNSKLFRLDYRRETITAKELFDEGNGPNGFPLVYHGVKDGSAIAAVRERYELDKK